MADLEHLQSAKQPPKNMPVHRCCLTNRVAEAPTQSAALPEPSKQSAALSEQSAALSEQSATSVDLSGAPAESAESAECKQQRMKAEFEQLVDLDLEAAERYFSSCQDLLWIKQQERNGALETPCDARQSPAKSTGALAHSQAAFANLQAAASHLPFKLLPSCCLTRCP